MGGRVEGDDRQSPSLKVLFHVKHEPSPAAGAAIGSSARTLDPGIGPAALSSLAAFEGLLAERAVPMGMVSQSDAHRLRERHVLDCLRAVVAVREGDRLALDLGSGAGLPGLVVAIARPTLTVRLIESRRARAAFLELAIDHLKVPNATVLASRVEDVVESADLCLARAFAPLSAAWEAAERLLRPGGRLVYFAGTGMGDADVPERVARVQVVEPVLASSGPLIIMTR